MNTLDPNRRSILEQELAEVVAQRAELDATIAYLRRRLGLPPGEADNTAAPTPAIVNATGDVSSLVNPGQFYGLSTTKAAAALLKIVGKERPLKTREVFEAIIKGGATPKSAEVVGKMMKRSPMFHRQRPGMLWGLAEWYPASVRSRGSTDDPDLQAEPDLEPEDGDDESDSDEVNDENG